jgi:hypothetical protein
MPTNKRKTLHRTVEEWCIKDYDGPGRHLPLMLQVAVPLWMVQFRDAGPETRAEALRQLEKSDLGDRLDSELRKGPKPDDSARAFNDLCKAIALLSFCRGGVLVFGTRYQWHDAAGQPV